MDIQFWQQLAEVKAGILEIACSLEDRMADHDKAASKLLELSKGLHELENMCLSQKKQL